MISRKTIIISLFIVINIVGSEKNLRRLEKPIDLYQEQKWIDDLEKHPCWREEEQLISSGLCLCTVIPITCPHGFCCFTCWCASLVMATENLIKKGERDTFIEGYKNSIKKIE